MEYTSLILCLFHLVYQQKFTNNNTTSMFNSFCMKCFWLFFVDRKSFRVFFCLISLIWIFFVLFCGKFWVVALYFWRIFDLWKFGGFEFVFWGKFVLMEVENLCGKISWNDLILLISKTGSITKSFHYLY